MSITLRDLLPRVMMYRPELDDAKGMFALTEAARRLGQTAAIFRYPSIHNAMTVGEREFVVGVDSEFKDSSGSVFRVESVAVADIPEGLDYAGPWDAETNTPYLGEPSSEDMPASWKLINDVGDPLPLMEAPVAHVYGNKIMLYGKAANPAAGGAFRTAIKVYNTDTDTWNPTVLWINEATYRQCGVADLPQSVPYTPIIMSVRVHPVTPDGRAIIFGGLPPGTSVQLSSASWVYNFSTHTVVSGPVVPTNIFQQYTSIVTDIGSGQFLLYAGQCDSGVYSSGTVNIPGKIPFIWDYNENSISALPEIPQPFINNYVVYWGLGVVGRKLYVYDNPFVNSVQRDIILEYDIDTGTSITKYNEPTNIPNKKFTLFDCAHVAVGDKIYFIGGTASSGSPNALCRFDTVSGTITQLITIANTNGPETTINVDSANSDRLYIANLSSATSSQRVFGYYSISKNKFVQMPLNIGGQKTVTSVLVPFSDMLYSFDGNGSAVNANHEVFNPFRPSNTGRYYTVSAHGTTDKSGIAQWDKGDVIYNDGTSWHRIRLDKFVYITQMNDPGLNKASANAEFGDGVPQSWWQRNGRVFWTVRPDRTYPVRLDLSYAPIGNEIASIDIPAECESVLVDGALSMLYSLPGQNMSPQLAAAADMRFKKGMATVRAIGMFGYGGTPQYYSGTAFGPQWNTIAVNWMER